MSGIITDNQGRSSGLMKSAASGGFTISSTITVGSGSDTWDITGIPSTASLIFVNLQGISIDGGHNPQVRVGHAGGVQTAGCISTSFRQTAATSVQPTAATAGFVMYSAGDAEFLRGHMILSCKIKAAVSVAEIWTSTHQFYIQDTYWAGGAGQAIIDADNTPLDRVQLQIYSGGAFDDGTFSIAYI